MKKIFFILLSAILLGGLYSFGVVKHTKDLITYNVQTDKSRVDWIGAKKNDFHTGYFPIKSGTVQVNAGKLIGGEFVIDLANLKVTDRAGVKLEDHLKSSDFFDIAKFGEAKYTINTVNYASESLATVNGMLSLKGLSFPISFQVHIRNADEKGFFGEAFFSFDRTLFGIIYGVGNMAKDVQIAVHLFAK